MKSLCSTCLLMFLAVQAGHSQQQYSGEQQQAYLGWFQSSTNTSDDRLLSFAADVPVYRQPNRQSTLLAKLPLGALVIPTRHTTEEVIYESINGYDEPWVAITICDHTGTLQQAYVWGGYLAKSWQRHDIDQDGQQEIVALGIPSTPRTDPGEVTASVQIIKNRQLLIQVAINGLCISNDCGSNSLVRVLEVGQQLQVIELSILTEGALSGVDKASLQWIEGGLRLVHRAEFITGHEYVNQPIYFQQNNAVKICHYQGETERFAPLWGCKVLDSSVAVP